MLAPALLTVEILRFSSETSRATAALNGLARHAQVTSTSSYRGESDLLLVWGPGAPNRWPAMHAQQTSGRHVLALDLAYWDRARKVRVSIDAPHPQAWVMRQDWPVARLAADHIPIRSWWNPDGPIVIAAIGAKAKQQYGDVVGAWEAEMVAACRARWPERSIVYREKPRVPDPQIEAGLTGASLVITWHSNVAVDAIRLGIPVVCRDGAAAAVCPSELPDHPQPLPADVRDRFLANLAWFQWNPDTEAALFWAWVHQVLA